MANAFGGPHCIILITAEGTFALSSVLLKNPLASPLALSALSLADALASEPEEPVGLAVSLCKQQSSESISGVRHCSLLDWHDIIRSEVTADPTASQDLLYKLFGVFT